MDPLQKIQKARAGLVLDHPFFGSLALRQRVEIDETAETAWTDGTTMGFNPSFVDGLSIEHLKGIIAHEVMHIGLAHHARRGDRDHKKWNMAGDYAINNILLDSKFSLPDGALVGYEKLSTEAIYSQIPDPPKDSSPDPGQCGEVRDAKGQDGQTPSPADLAKAEADAKVALAQAAQQARAMGKIPESIARMVEEVLEPKVDWKEVLRRFISQAAKADYSWTPPNRRYIHQGIYLPSLRSEEIGRIAVAVDTSGSVGKAEIAVFAGELSGIIEETGATVEIIYCDSKVANIETITPDDLPLSINPIGGGGTSFKPPFEHINNSDDTPPACCIYLTDGYCSEFPDTPEYPVLWALTEKSGFNPPFGEVLAIE